MVQEEMQKTGYDGTWETAYESNNADLPRDDYFVVKGFSEIIHQLVQELETMSNVTLYTNHCIQE